MGGPRHFMHVENAALAQHGCSVGHQTVEIDILGKVVGDDAIKLPRHHHVFGPTVNELDVAQSKVAGLLPGKVEIGLVEFHSGYAAVGEAAGDFKGQNASATGLLENALRRLRHPFEELAFPPAIQSQGRDAGDMIVARRIFKKKPLGEVLGAQGHRRTPLGLASGRAPPAGGPRPAPWRTAAAGARCDPMNPMPRGIAQLRRPRLAVARIVGPRPAPRKGVVPRSRPDAFTAMSSISAPHSHVVAIGPPPAAPSPSYPSRR